MTRQMPFEPLPASVLLGVAGFGIGALNVADSELVIGIPEALTCLLCCLVLCLTLPSGDRFERAPVGNGNSETVRASNGLDAKKAWLLRGKLNHAVGNVAVASVALAALRREDDCIIRRLGSSGERAGW